MRSQFNYSASPICSSLLDLIIELFHSFLIQRWHPDAKTGMPKAWKERIQKRSKKKKQKVVSLKCFSCILNITITIKTIKQVCTELRQPCISILTSNLFFLLVSLGTTPQTVTHVWHSKKQNRLSQNTLAIPLTNKSMFES